MTGKAFTGKTYFIKAHVKAISQNRTVAIYDFNREYDEFTTKKHIGVWQVNRGSSSEIEEFIGRCYNAGNCTVVLSESDNYLRMNSPVLLSFVTTGRNRGVNAIIDGKRPMSVRPEYRSRFNHLILFQTTLPDDIEYLEDWTGTGKGSLDHLKTLKQGEYLHADTDNQTVSEILRL